MAPSAPPLGATVWVPVASIWVAAAFGGGERKESKISITNLGHHERPIFGVPGAPRTGRQLTPPLAAIKKNFGAVAASQMVLKS